MSASKQFSIKMGKLKSKRDVWTMIFGSLICRMLKDIYGSKESFIFTEFAGSLIKMSVDPADQASWLLENKVIEQATAMADKLFNDAKDQIEPGSDKIVTFTYEVHVL